MHHCGFALKYFFILPPRSNAAVFTKKTVTISQAFQIPIFNASKTSPPPVPEVTENPGETNIRERKFNPFLPLIFALVLAAGVALGYFFTFNDNLSPGVANYHRKGSP